MSGKTHTDADVKAFRFIDYFVILLLLAVAVYFVNLFRIDLFQTLDARNDDPVGVLVIKKNIVQRRLSDRVMWDRLSMESPVYSGDLIRVAENSAANLYIAENRIGLNENTLIRIYRTADSDTPFRIELSGGTLSLASGGDLILNVGGSSVEAPSGSEITVQTGEGGIAVRVSEGSVQFTGDGLVRKIESGGILSLDPSGTERTDKAVVVMSPQANARYLKSAGEPMPVVFSWSRARLENTDTLVLQIAADRNFTRSVRSIANLYSSAQVPFEAGQWYWRLSLDDKTLYEGSFTVTEAVPALISPVPDSQFRYQSDTANMYFQWSRIENASFYLVEIDDTPDFINPRIKRELTAASFVEADMKPGTWYWRVRPFFPAVYEGVSEYSPAASFRIEQSNVPLESVWQAPEPHGTFGSTAAAVVEEPVEEEPVQEEPPTPTPPAPLPPLAAPQNRLPAEGYRIGVSELRAEPNITFSWSEVTGANAYILTLYQETEGVRRLIFQREPQNITTWTMTDLSVLESGTFIWTVEAVSRNPNGTIGRRGRTGENSFIMDIPPAAEVQVQDTGVLYGD